MITVALVEDDNEIRESLALIIDGTPGYSCIGKYGDCETAIPAVTKNPPDVLLMDIGLPGISGIEGVKILREKLPHLDILILTIQEDDDSVFESLCAGAAGYLVKDTSPALLLNAINDVHQGGSPMSSQIARKVISSFQKYGSGKANLTRRETEILTHFSKGCTYQIIAETLFLSEETIRTHAKNIYRKLEVKSKTEAVHVAYKKGILRP